ncbi:alpha/beta hydrolase [Taibaiella lutea]|uniref:Alpha/beta hydrolase n=1 Tax=Taibaiella lutea TaxID=2608001 RepID=A0A5M6CPA0_9BACT|nr:alpha/beta hydrolase [Taibaiella lutea]KAA5536846.1 alpha/beta hydrolase [Taibaiella lutea]
MKSYFILLCFVLNTASALQAQESKKVLTATNFENIEYPFAVKYIHLNIQGEPLQMAYMDVMPDKPNGKVIVLLHGKNFCSAYWRQTSTDLTAKGFRVIMPDQIGFGKSSKPDNIQYTFQQLAQNTKAILDSLGVKKIYLLGHSMGGMLATRFTLMYPATVEKLILEDPIGLEDWKIKVPWQSVDDWYQRELKQDYASLKKYQQNEYYHGEWKPEYDEWLDMQAGLLNNIDYPRIAWNSALIYDMIFTQPVCYEFQQIETPTLLIIGQKDRTAIGKDKVSKEVQATMGNYPVLGKETAKKFLKGTLVEISGAGHLPHIETYPEFIAPLLKFLSK